MLHIHQFNMCILYKPGPELYIVDRLSHHNHTENKNQEIAGMIITIHTLSAAVDVLVCTSIENIRNAMSTDTELQLLQTYISKVWLQNRDNLWPTFGPYWLIRYDLVLTDSVAIKGKQIIIPFSLQKQILNQLYSKHNGLEETWLPARESVYWINMNADTEHAVKQCAMSFKYMQIQPKEKALHYEIPCTPWEVVGPDVFMINSKLFLVL